tara:strand:+ start:459 stop:1220 length:762 start_codon:yes stop_codon:yes gene_type:complete
MRFFRRVTLFIVCIAVSNVCANYEPKFEGRFRQYKKHPLDLIARFIPENPVIFEAGAHYGDDTVKFVKKWPSCTVHSFEPNPHAYSLLVNKVKDLKNVKHYNLAIADFNGKSLFYVCHGSNGNEPIYEGASSLLPPSEYMKQHYQGPRVEVDCAILDDWCKQNEVPGFDFMWLDMEGYELQALSASPKILATVKAIFVETNFQDFRVGMTQCSNLKRFLKSKGFKLLSHWYANGLQGNAIFIRSDLYPSRKKR